LQWELKAKKAKAILHNECWLVSTLQVKLHMSHQILISSFNLQLYSPAFMYHVTLTWKTRDKMFLGLWRRVIWSTRLINFVHTVYVWIKINSQNKQRIFACTSLTGWAL